VISTSSSDEKLFETVRDQQNKTAFEIVVHRYEKKVYGLCYRLLNSREEAEDMAQEIFIKLWEHPSEWQPKAKFSTWLYRVATNRCLNRMRFLKFKSFLSFNSEFEKYTASEEQSPDLDLISSEISKLFQQSFLKLPERQKAALHLRYWEKLSVRDVSDVLDVTVKSAESLIYRGKKTLGELLNSYNS